MTAGLENAVSVNTHMVSLGQLWKDTITHTKISKLVIYTKWHCYLEVCWKLFLHRRTILYLPELTFLC